MKKVVVVCAYGDKDTDIQAYLDSGIMVNKIFLIINNKRKKVELINIAANQTTSYEIQSGSINTLYPNISALTISRPNKSQPVIPKSQSVIALCSLPLRYLSTIVLFFIHIILFQAI